MRFRLLGPLEIVSSDDRVMTIPYARVRGLAAVLLFEAGQRVSRERLTDSLWDDPPPSAAANLRNHLATLRRSLRRFEPDDDRLVTFRGGHTASYGLRLAATELDVATFRDLSWRGGQELATGDPAAAVPLLRGALQLWRGQAGTDVCGSWRLRSRVEALNEQRITVSEQYLAARLACGETASVIHDCRDLLAAHPLRERCWGYLLRALYLNGDLSSAITAYGQARAVLGDVLGVEPSPALQRLHLAILRRDDALLRDPAHALEDWPLGVTGLKQ